MSIRLDNSTSIRDFLVSIREYLKSMQWPMWADRSSNRLRVTASLESGTVTTVTTVTNLTNIDSYQGRVAMLGSNYAAWALVVRERIS